MKRVAVVIGAGAVIDATAELGYGNKDVDRKDKGVDTRYVTDNILNPRYAGNSIESETSKILMSVFNDLGSYCQNPNFEDLYEFLIRAKGYVSGTSIVDTG